MSDFQYFIVHYHALSERRRYLEDQFAVVGEQPRFIEIERSNPDLPRVLYSGDELEWYRKARAVYGRAEPFRPLTRAEMSNAASHVLALNSIEAAWGVILEDDAVLTAQFFDTVRGKLPKLPANVGCVFLGGGFPHDLVATSIARFDCFHIKTHPATNTAVAYAVRRELAQRVARDCRGFDHPFDHELSYLLMAANALVAHVIPYVVLEGSKTGAYPSALEPGRSAVR